MKKIIVLYGNGEMGKSITLKTVYEELKKYNLAETHWFRYYDRNRAHIDFQDVLILEKQKLFEIGKPPITKILQTDSDKKTNDFKSCCNNIISLIREDNPTLGKVIIDDYLASNSLNDKLKQWEEENANVIGEEVAPEDDFVPPKIDDNDIRRENGGIIDFDKVGIILEGDYGFVHIPHSQGTTCYKHHRNLYKHLMNLIFCDVIICSCTIFHTTNILEQPLFCLYVFLIEYYLSTGMIPNVSFVHKTYGGKLWTDKLAEDKKTANKILSYL